MSEQDVYQSEFLEEWEPNSNGFQIERGWNSDGRVLFIVTWENDLGWDGDDDDEDDDGTPDEGEQEFDSLEEAIIFGRSLIESYDRMSKLLDNEWQAIHGKPTDEAQR